MIASGIVLSVVSIIVGLYLTGFIPGPSLPVSAAGGFKLIALSGFALVVGVALIVVGAIQ